MAEIASAFVTIAPSAKGFGSKLNSEVSGPIRSSGTSLGKTFGKLFAVGAGVIAAAGIGSLLKGSIDEAREAQKVGAQTTAVLKSTGGVANVSAGQIGKLASALSAKIGVDDEAIQAGQNMLLTFTNVRNEAGKGNKIFSEATRTVQDMAAAFGGDATSNSKILGKALNDPAKGVSALTKVGVTFTDKQKEQIKTFQESGNILGAQKIILRELGKETKGSAEAQATAGDKASVALGNLKETIGTALLPVIDRLANTFTNKIAPAITTFIGQLQSGEGAGGKVAAVFSTVVSVLGTVFGFISQHKAVVTAFVGTIVAITVATAAYNAVLAANPIGLVVIAIAALVAGLVYAYQHSKTFKNIVDAAFSGIKKTISAVIGFVVPFVKNHWKLLVSIIGGPVAAIAILVATHFGTIKKVVGNAIDFVVGTAKKVGAFAKAVGQHVADAANFFKRLPGKIKGFLTSLPGELKTIGGQIIDGLVSGIKGAAHKVEEVVQGIINKIPKKIRSIMGIASPSKVTKQLGEFISLGLAQGIISKGDKVTKAVAALTKSLKDKLKDLASDFSSLVDPIASNFTQGLFDFDNASDFTANLTTVKGTLQTMIANFKKLIAEGLSPGFLYQLFQSGGPGLINSLAGLDAASAQDAGALFGQVSSLSTELGGNVAGATQAGAANLKEQEKTNRLLTAIEKHQKDFAHEVAEAINQPAKRARRKAKT